MTFMWNLDLAHVWRYRNLISERKLINRLYLSKQVVIAALFPAEDKA